MNAVEIEQAVSELAEQPFDAAEFRYALLMASGIRPHAALAILSLTLHYRDQVWKGVDWAITDRLHDKGLIENPRRKAKSLTLTAEGIERARAVLEREFTKVE